MIGTRKHLTKTQLALAAAAVSSVALLSGCANMVTTAGNQSTLNVGDVQVGGSVFGGNQAVANATIQLYEVGQNGDTNAPTLLATTTTDNAGSFQFTKMAGTAVQPNTGSTYTCPTDYGLDGLLYVKSTGGNTLNDGSTNRNQAAVFLAPVGYCSQITSSTRIYISEATTAAMVAAVGQFISPTDEGIRHDGIGTAYTAVGNSFKVVANMVSPTTGLAQTSVTIAGTGANTSGTTVIATPETAKINTIANILSSCVNQATATSGTNCSTLFANAAAPPFPSRTAHPNATFPTATDTLQAALYMFINPTSTTASNRQNLFNLQPGVGAPFQPTLAAVPTDWTLGIAYAASGTCASGKPFYAKPYDLSVDPAGNLWVGNSATATSGVSQISPIGVPLNCVGTGNNVATVIDSQGNIWYGDSASNSLTRYTASGTSLTYTTAGPVLGLAADGSGSIFFTTTDGTTGSVYKITNGAASTTTNSPSLISNTVGILPSRIFPDNAGDLFVTSGQGFVTEVSAATGGNNFVGGYTSTFFSAPTPTYGVVVGPANRVYITSRDPGASLTVYAPSGTTYALQGGFPTASNTAGLTNPAGVWIDGSQNSYVANNAPETSNGAYSLSVISLDGTAVSGGGTANGGYQKAAAYYNAPRQTVVDSAGNVWVTNDNNLSSITEVVGAGVPIYTPYAVGLRIGRFQNIP